jgi:hypothetical protein
LLRKRNGAYYLAIWQEVPSYDTRTKTDLDVPDEKEDLSFQKPFRRILLYDPLKGADPIQTWNKAENVEIEVPDHVLILELLP